MNHPRNLLTRTHVDAIVGEFSLKNWPCESDEARADRDKLLKAKTHRLEPLRAYAENKVILSAGDYRSSLPRSLVRVDFTLRHWSMTDGEKDSYRADISSVNILKKGLPLFSSPSKRKRVLDRTFDPTSPTKKRRGE